jgi:Superinfection immunity protein
MSAILLVALAFVLAAVYFLPAIIAVRRRCRWDAAIFVFNLLLGWTVFGWFAALNWALGGRIRGSIRPTEVVAHMRVVERTPDASGVASSERGGAA